MHLALSAHLVGLILDPEDRGEGLENAPFDRFGCGDVEAVRALEQIEVCQDYIGVTLDLFIGARELLEESPPLHGEAAQTSFHCIRRKFTIGCDVEQVRLLDVELLQLRRQPRARFSLPLLLDVERFLHMAPHLRSKPSIQR
ncbi:MAG: hypothetical protein BGO45_12895 [Microbacterium sp. 71-36]|uniref:hypothetical protein n=1 Tax=unclassified Microbacterium TaxID=2609290 RepID=UPI00086D2A53|nr:MULTISPECIES: hypothetical protein [unclassified Microbacterium]MBN9211790.1 hypothetical protein [Microbacterium sp.]ODT41061.1 MAG: hypothetical protein ABS60_03025 [Microbacterium sp. SCN 71-17]OJV77640.1 MAG: hypothetical protein BGO45_12895 [Microbacterium sp. 71-36]